uniref:Si:ch211-212d10.2 n=1 Tax=Seriola lalandi dorsalis TaxID=1841481 RepID=A0A3B4XPQ0_SERLL
MASGSGDEEGNTEGVSWRLIGPASELSKKRCRLMHSSLGYDSDVCLFYVKGEFFAMDARCSHSGGPLCEGDIEEADGVLQVFCPWHDYDFDLRTGKSGTSLQVSHEILLCAFSVIILYYFSTRIFNCLLKLCINTIQILVT